jgi:hypothetical protein
MKSTADAFEVLTGLADGVAMERFFDTSQQLLAACNAKTTRHRRSPPPANAAAALGMATGDLMAHKSTMRFGSDRIMVLDHANLAKFALDRNARDALEGRSGVANQIEHGKAEQMYYAAREVGRAFSEASWAERLGQANELDTLDLNVARSMADHLIEVIETGDRAKAVTEINDLRDVLGDWIAANELPGESYPYDIRERAKAQPL